MWHHVAIGVLLRSMYLQCVMRYWSPPLTPCFIFPWS
jgi:hypothetical protein